MGELQVGARAPAGSYGHVYSGIIKQNLSSIPTPINRK